MYQVECGPQQDRMTTLGMTLACGCVASSARRSTSSSGHSIAGISIYPEQLFAFVFLVVIFLTRPALARVTGCQYCGTQYEGALAAVDDDRNVTGRIPHPPSCCLLRRSCTCASTHHCRHRRDKHLDGVLPLGGGIVRSFLHRLVTLDKSAITPQRSKRISTSSTIAILQCPARRQTRKPSEAHGPGRFPILTPPCRRCALKRAQP